jgi:hypothetical protein
MIGLIILFIFVLFLFYRYRLKRRESSIEYEDIAPETNVQYTKY